MTTPTPVVAHRTESPEPAALPTGAASMGRREPESRLFELIAATRHVVAPTTLLTALAFYFGWVYTNARALYFGIDPSALGFSTQDYLLRSIEPIFLPLAVVLLVAVGLVWLHGRLLAWAASPGRPVAAVTRTVVALGVVVFVLGASGWLNHPILGTDFLITPLGLGLGPAAVLYGVRLHRRLHPSAASGPQPAAASPNALTGPLVFVLAVMSLFAAVDDWAGAVGRGRAQQLAENLSQRPAVVVYSKEQLHLVGPGVQAQSLAAENSAYLYRYGGLRLLVRSDGKYFLLPEGWTRSNGRAVILPDTKELRYEFEP